MVLSGPVQVLDPDLTTEVETLAGRAGHEIGHTPIGSPGWRRLVGEPSDRFVAAWATSEDDKLTAYAQGLRSAADPTWVAEVLVPPEEAGRLADLGSALIGRILERIGELGGGHLHLWALDATPAHAELAARCGLEPHRELHQMRRRLPIEPTTTLPLRAFVPGRDEDEVLEVNRRAFAHHPDQGHMSRQMLEERMEESWFDPEGFLVYEEDGRIGGFCWTKLFAETDPLVGEIHVICVDPDFGGRSLGLGLVEAGLAHLASAGRIGMLFVEADNQPALDLYQRLGFSITRTDRAFATTISP